MGYVNLPGFPDAWAVFNNNSVLFKNKVAPIIEKQFGVKVAGLNSYYGFDHGLPIRDDTPGFTPIITLEQFMEKYEEGRWSPVYGESVEVSDNSTGWYKRTYAATLPESVTYRYLVIKDNESHVGWRFMRRIKPKPAIVEMTLEEIAAKLNIPVAQLRIKD